MKAVRRLGATAVLLCAACGGGGSGTPPQELAIALVDAFPGLSFDQPLVFASAPGDADNVWVATRKGLVYRFPNDAQTATASVVLDLRGRLDASGGEQGLLGLAFDPGYASNGRVYVNRTIDAEQASGDSNATLIARFSPGDAGPLATETRLLEFDQPFDNHNGGWLGFGDDGLLYIASGDGGGSGDLQNNAQNLNSLLGKMLRIDTDGSIPPDNPFAGDAGRRGEIWAYGLRNPYRASFDRASGDLWIGDVGQNQLEEIDVAQAGGNYGWRKFEGTQIYNAGDPDPGNAIAPLYEYDHGNDRCSITGGYVYRGAAIPTLVGRYVFADFCSREIWALRRDGGNVTVTALGTVPGNPSSFGEDAAGELYITAFDGKIYKLVSVP
ncbi:MAG: PQQ-dependent sugar dehydrogenase [Pseudomonadota bacterium]|nr:PQQ-dependent sugar dehydrogenase [Pseudomonadota bacterium]